MQQQQLAGIYDFSSLFKHKHMFPNMYLVCLNQGVRGDGRIAKSTKTRLIMSPAVSAIVSLVSASSGRMTFLRTEKDWECGQG